MPQKLNCIEKTTFIRRNVRGSDGSFHRRQKIPGFEELEYYKLIREQIEEFRLLFIDWVAEFNPRHFVTDDWGLFNPPGIGPDYEQRNDELNFLDEDDD